LRLIRASTDATFWSGMNHASLGSVGQPWRGASLSVIQAEEVSGAECRSLVIGYVFFDPMHFVPATTLGSQKECAWRLRST